MDKKFSLGSSTSFPLSSLVAPRRSSTDLPRFSLLNPDIRIRKLMMVSNRKSSKLIGT